MAISLHTAGSWVAANATTQTVALPTHSTGDMLLVRVGFKHATMPTTVTCDTAGWAKVATEVNGTGGASSNGGGGVEVCAFWKEAASAAETNPVITFDGGSVAATPSAAVANSYSKGAGETWNTPVGAGAAVAAATSISATIASHISTTAGDLVDEFHVTNDNTTLTVPTFTQSAVTFAAVVESPATALSSTTSNDIAADGCYRIANSGTSSAAAVITGTNSVADLGAAWTTRLRVFTPETHSGGMTATGGGVTTSAQSKGGQSGHTATGGGVFAYGYEVASVENHDGSFAATGGGVSAFGALTARDGGHIATGSGVAAAGASTDRSGLASATGGGATPIGQSTERSTGTLTTGGGIFASSAEAARFGAALMSGGGVYASLETTDRLLGFVATGGGVATMTGTASTVEEHSGDFAVTGGGVFVTEASSERLAGMALTGGGAAVFGASTDRLAGFTATGGGEAIMGTGTVVVDLAARNNLGLTITSTTLDVDFVWPSIEVSP